MIQIKNWNETFENADTRKRQRLGWFLCPTGTDSAGYIELMSHGERGIRAFAVFTAICQWSATCLPLVRGSCARSDGRAMSARQIATVIRMPENIVTDALELLASEDVGWILCENTDVLNVKLQSAGAVPVSCQSSAGSMPQGEGEGEGEGKGEDRPRRAANVFVAPSVSEVAEYVKEIGAVVDALDFVNYYTSNGWMVGRSKMKDWKAAVRTWNSKRLKPDDQYDEDPKFMRLLRIATQKGTSNECDVEWRRNNMSQEEREAVRVNCIRFETLADAKLHPLERKRIAKLYITTLRGMESLKNG